MKAKSQPKIFVLDTSVILYDHQAPTEFDDNHIAIPIQVLEELDNFKKGNDTRNFAARQFIRLMVLILYGLSMLTKMATWIWLLQVSLKAKSTGTKIRMVVVILV